MTTSRHSRRSCALAILATAVLLVGGCAEVDPPSTSDGVTDAALPTSSSSPAGIATEAAAPSPTPAALLEKVPAAAAPVVTRKTVTETKKIAFATKTVNDSSLAEGTTRVRTKGVAGVRTLTYELTLTDGVRTDRRLVSDTVTKRPVAKVVVVGTKPPSAGKCDPNYSGCVPIASDVDCAGGSGNGPAYVDGPVRVVGSDIYRLDADDDGYGCE
jgi:resuscitation-promoting factor RpfB